MAELCCKHCGSGSFVRNGMAAGHQRYRCKACGRNFTATPARGKPPAMKALAVLLYSLGNVSQGMIAKLLGVSHVAVYEWVRAAGEGTPAPSATPLQLDDPRLGLLAVELRVVDLVHEQEREVPRAAAAQVLQLRPLLGDRLQVGRLGLGGGLVALPAHRSPLVTRQPVPRPGQRGRRRPAALPLRRLAG